MNDYISIGLAILSVVHALIAAGHYRRNDSRAALHMATAAFTIGMATWLKVN